MRTTLLVIHILAAATWLGANMVQVATNPRLRSYPTEAATWWLRHVAGLGRNLYTPAAVVLLLTGIFLVTDSRAYEFSSNFVSVGFAAVAVGAVLGVLVFAPRSRRAAAALETGDEAGFSRLMSSLTGFGVLDTAIIVIAFVAMVGKWGA